MQIDWFTFIAQIVNFLILAAALKFLLYDRVTAAMRKRSDSIAAQFREAETRKGEAEDRRSEYERKIEELDERRDSVLAESREEAERRRSEMLEEARREVRDRRAQWHDSLREERDDFLRELRRRASREVFETARGVIGELAGVDLEERIAERFVERLEGLDEKRRRRLAETAGGGDGAIAVRSAFALSDDARDAIEKTVRTAISRDAEIRFERSPELICGIELAAAGVKASWSAGDYLDGLEERVAAMLDEAGGDRKEETSDE